jgi:hypothetical protein
LVGPDSLKEEICEVSEGGSISFLKRLCGKLSIVNRWLSSSLAFEEQGEGDIEVVSLAQEIEAIWQLAIRDEVFSLLDLEGGKDRHGLKENG